MGACAVVGGQFGSEGKGLIVGHIADEFTGHVRVGAANAGHTLYTDDCKHVMQQLPCSVYANPAATAFVGPGALISPGIFERELRTLRTFCAENDRDFPVIVVDPNAHVIQEWQIQEEKLSDLAERIGSTSATANEGIGACQAARVMRKPGCVTAADFWDDDECEEHGFVIEGVPTHTLDHDFLLLEGTQGTGLSITTGHFPYVTSRNTTAAGLCADAGVAPTRLDRVILVCRTYPIRVASPTDGDGTSGPFYHDSEETSWEALGIDPQTERTTVTKKVRRVATFSLDQIAEAAMINGATEIALTFADYLDPRIAGLSSRDSGVWTTLEDYPDVNDMVWSIMDELDIPVTMIGTGPNSVIDLYARGTQRLSVGGYHE